LVRKSIHLNPLRFASRNLLGVPLSALSVLSASQITIPLFLTFYSTLPY
jgi:hypothetical protein